MLRLDAQSTTAVTRALYVGRTPDDDQTVTLRGELDLNVGQSYLFGLIFSSSPAINAVSLYCANQNQIANRNGSAAP